MTDTSPSRTKTSALGNYREEFVQLIAMDREARVQMVLSQSDRGQELIDRLAWTLKSLEEEEDSEAVQPCKMVLELVEDARDEAEARLLGQTPWHLLN